MTHAELVECAAVWLRKRFPVVITEMVTSNETPDAIGFNSRTSTVIECKTSRADFLRDREKRCHRYGKLMGGQRYYLAEHGVLRVNELPPGHGLLEVKNGKTRATLSTLLERDDRDFSGEIGLLVSCIRRLLVSPKVEGVSVRVYTTETKCAATLSIGVE
jgi:hypothetical protein